MTHRKEFKRPDKSTVQVEVRLYTEAHRSKFEWSTVVLKRGYRCHNFRGCANTEATPQEMQETALELWEAIKPNFLEALA